MEDFLYRSEKIKEFRIKKGITQIEFAKRVGVSKGYIGQIETGMRKVNIKFLDKLRRAFNIHEDQILEIIYGSPAPSGFRESRNKELPSQINIADLVNAIEAGMETEDFLSFPIQTFDSAIQANGPSSGRVVIHKRVFGRRKNLAAIQLNGGKETKIVIVGK